MAKRKPKPKTAKRAKPEQSNVVRSRARRRQFLDLYRKHGKASVVLRMMQLSRSWYDKWRRNPQFAAAFEEAQEDFIAGIEEEARRRAVDGVEKDIYHHGRKVGKEKVYSDRLLLAILRRHLPEAYRENSRVEHTGEVSSKVTIDYSRRLPNPDEARERVLAAAALLQQQVTTTAPANGTQNGSATSNGNGHHKNGNGHSNGHH